MPCPIFSSSEHLLFHSTQISADFPEPLACLPGCSLFYISISPMETISLKCHYSPTPPHPDSSTSSYLGVSSTLSKEMLRSPRSRTKFGLLLLPRPAAKALRSHTLTNCPCFSSYREGGEKEGYLDGPGSNLLSTPHWSCTFGHWILTYCWASIRSNLRMIFSLL